MRSLLIAVFAALFLPLAASAATRQAQPQESAALERVGVAERLLSEGKSEQALAAIDELLAEDEEFDGAWFVGGVALGRMGRYAEARDYFVRATEITPGWGEAHRLASIASADIGDLDASWDHAVKAHQAGVDMSDAFAELRAISSAPEDIEEQLGAATVFVAGFDSTTFERGGTNTSAKGILTASAGDRFALLQEMRRQLAAARSFGLVPRQERAQYMMVIDIDTMNTRQLRGVLKLLDTRSGEEAYRRRIDLADISSTAYLARELNRIVSLMEDWAKERQR